MRKLSNPIFRHFLPLFPDNLQRAFDDPPGYANAVAYNYRLIWLR
jgi:hypothetical protein